jgi:hypothetical protein
MKQLFVLFFAALFSVSTTYASVSPTTPAAEVGLSTTFPLAENVKWSNVNDYYKAQFNIDNKDYTAFFTFSGDLVASTRNVSSDELPKGLRQSLNEEMKDSWITGLVMMSTKEGDTYFVQLENATNKVIKKSVGNKKWSAYTPS